VPKCGFVAQSTIFFLQNLTLGYMTKTLKQIFFPLHQNQNIFFSNIGNQNICLEKNHNPPYKYSDKKNKYYNSHVVRENFSE
jgi:hypothetical protein